MNYSCFEEVLNDASAENNDVKQLWDETRPTFSNQFKAQNDLYRYDTEAQQMRYFLFTSKQQLKNTN